MHYAPPKIINIYQDVTDEEFFNIVFSEEDRLDLVYVREAKKRQDRTVPYFCSILAKEENYTWNDKRFWGVVHAVYILGILSDERAIHALITAGKFADTYANEWILDALPECYLRLGRKSVPELMHHITKCKAMSSPAIASAALGLWNIWYAYPDTKKKIESFLLSIIKSPDTSLEIRTNLIADFAKIGRKDLKPLLDGFYERGETDLNIFMRDDIERLFAGEDKPTLSHYDLDEFYKPEEIAGRQQIWAEEQEKLRHEAVDEYILQNYKTIGKQENCPCGSGKQFEDCHLIWAEQQLQRLKEKGKVITDAMMQEIPVVAERLYENELRRFLARKKKTRLFSELKAKVMELTHAPIDDFISGSFVTYFEPIFAKIGFDGAKDYKIFMKSFMEYFNALSRQRYTPTF